MKLVRQVESLLSVPPEIKAMSNGNFEADQLTNLQLTTVLKHNKTYTCNNNRTEWKASAAMYLSDIY